MKQPATEKILPSMGVNDPQKGFLGIMFAILTILLKSLEVQENANRIFSFPNIVMMKWTVSKQDVDDDDDGDDDDDDDVGFYPKCWALSQSIPEIPINQLPTITRVRLNRFLTLQNLLDSSIIILPVFSWPSVGASFIKKNGNPM